jgi:hypothetical protein
MVSANSMNWRLKKRTPVLFALFIALLPFSLGADGKSVGEGLKPALWNHDLGVILSTPSLFFDIESYQGGIGAKISVGQFVVRGMADLLINTGFNPFSITLGATLEKHFLPGPISPYWGVYATVGYTRLKKEIDADNWTLQTAFPFTVGGLLGIEIFIFDFLSIFIEYGLPLELGINTTQTSVAGSVSSSSEFTYKVDLGLSNQSMIGIVIYLTRKRFR